MIDFNETRTEGAYGIPDCKEALESYAATIRKDLEESKHNFFWLGVHLIDLYSSKTYSITFDREKLKVSFLYGNCCSECFFAYCYDEFGLDKTQVSRLMNIVDEFGDGLRCFKKQWEKFSYSQLCELLPLSDEERKAVKPDWTIRKIREYKKSLVATSQQIEMELPESEEPPQDMKYARFEKWSKRELCDKIFDLEVQYEELLQENKRLRLSALDKAG